MNPVVAAALLLSLGVYAAGAGVGALLSTQLARSLRSKVRARAYLHEGDETVMFVGVVAPAGGESAERDPVRVSVTQSAEMHAGHVSWRETARALDARPFDLVCEGGRRVRVEPDANTLLALELDAVSLSNDGRTRTRAAVLALGARVVVCGAPHRALVPSASGEHLRDGAALGLALCAPRGESLTIFDEHPERAHLERAKAHRAAGFSAGFACTSLLLYFGGRMTEQAATAAMAALLLVALEHLWLLSRVRPWYLRERIDDVEPRRARLTPTAMLPK